MPVEVWTGGSMRAGDAIEQLRRDGFPVERLDLGEDAHPHYNRHPGESSERAQERWAAACARWDADRAASILAAAGKVALRHMTEHAVSRSILAEWRGDKGFETAILRLAQEHCRRFPSDAFLYVFGQPEQLKALIAGGVPNLPGPPGGGASPPPPGVPGLKPRAYYGFMSVTLALVPLPEIRYPLTIASEAYAVAVHAPDILNGLVEVGVMPTREYTGVVGATAEQLAANAAAIIDANAPPTFDAQDFKAKLRLRRLMNQGKGDNPG